MMKTGWAATHVILLTLASAGRSSESGRDPGAVPTAEAVRQGLRRHLESLRPAGAPPGRYRFAPDKEPSLLATCDAVFLRWMVGDPPDEAEREAWIDEILSHQDPRTGAWPGGLHRFGMAIRALNMLGGKPRHPLRFLEPHADPDSMGSWVDAKDWKSPWGPSIEILHAATPRVLAEKKAGGDRAWSDRFFARLEAHQDPRTGLWGTDVGASHWDGMGGAFHFFPIYRAAGRPLPHAERMLESVLALREPSGSFRSGYGQMDACHILRVLADQLGEKAGARVRAREALRGVFDRMLASWDPQAKIFRGAPDLHEMVAIYQTIGYTTPAAPDHPLARLAWRDAWGPELWSAELPFSRADRSHGSRPLPSSRAGP